MTTDREAAEVVRSWMKQPVELDDAGFHRVLARLPETRQRRYRWLPSMPAFQWRTDAMFSATKYLVAGLIIALFGAVLATTSRTEQQAAPVVPAAEASSPTPLPSAAPMPSQTPASEDVSNLRWPEILQSDGMVWEPRNEPRTWTLVSEPHAHFPGAQEMAIGADGRPWFWEAGGCGDPMSDEEVMCAWQMGTPGWTGFPPPGAYWLNDLAVSDDGVLWAGTQRGLQSFDGQSWTRHGGSDTLVLTIAPDGVVRGFGGGEGSISSVRYASGEFSTDDSIGAFADYGPDRSLIPFDALVTGSGETWVGGGRMGAWSFIDFERGFLARHDGESWQAMRPLGANDEPGVLALAEAPDGAIWTLLSDTDGRRLSRFDGDAWIIYSVEDGAPPEMGTGLAVGSDGTVWLTLNGTEEGSDGIAAFDGRTWTRYLDGLRINHIGITPGDTVIAAMAGASASDTHVIAIRPDAEIVETE